MPPIVIRPLALGEELAAATLWDRCGLTTSYNPPHWDIAFCRASAGAELLAAVDGEALVGTVMVGHDGHRGWFYYLAVAPERQGEGLGRRLVAAAEGWLKERKVWKVQCLIRRTNAAVIDFYAGLDYGESDVVVMNKVIGAPE